MASLLQIPLRGLGARQVVKHADYSCKLFSTSNKIAKTVRTKIVRQPIYQPVLWTPIIPEIYENPFRAFQQKLFVMGTCESDYPGSDESVLCTVRDALKENGHPIEDLINGVGSSRRTYDTLDRIPVDPDALPGDDCPLLEIPFLNMTGALFGSGLDFIVDDIMEQMKSNEGRPGSFKIAGFSRGAVAILKAVETYYKRYPTSQLKVDLDLLDPVPGPGNQSFFDLPHQVNTVHLAYSIDHGIAGFSHATVKVSSATISTGMLVSGVHGCIGGSSKNNISKLNADSLARRSGLTGILSDDQRDSLAIEQAMSGYSFGIQHYLSRRGYEHSPGPLSPIYQLPFSGAAPRVEKKLRRLALNPTYSAFEKEFGIQYPELVLSVASKLETHGHVTFQTPPALDVIDSVMTAKPEPETLLTMIGAPHQKAIY